MRRSRMTLAQGAVDPRGPPIPGGRYSCVRCPLGAWRRYRYDPRARFVARRGLRRRVAYRAVVQQTAIETMNISKKPWNGMVKLFDVFSRSSNVE